MKSLLFFAGILAIALMLVAYSQVLHEKTHVVIFSEFGVDSVAEFTLAGGRTRPLEGFASEERRNAAYLGHAVNEVVGYNVTPFLLIIIALFLVQSFFLIKLTASVEQIKRGKEV